jgi:hypothetical protein
MMLTTQRRAKRGNKWRRGDVVGDRCGGRSLNTAAVLQEEGTRRSWHGEHTRVRSEKEKKEVEGQGTSPTATRCFSGQQWSAAGNSLGSGARARVEGCGVQADAEKEVQGLKLGFYREG